MATTALEKAASLSKPANLVDVRLVDELPQARSQGGANACNFVPPLDARSAWQAMNIVHLMFIAVQCTCTHINEICHAVVCMYIVHVCM